MTPEQIRGDLESQDAEVRRQAIAAVAEVDAPDLQLLVVNCLGDVDWRVRAEAARTLAVVDHRPNVTRRLVDVLIHETDVGFRNAAVDALGGRGEDAVMAIVEAAEQLDADGRKLAAEALARTATSSALIPLELLATDSDPNVQATAIEAIAQVGRSAPERALPLLSQALSAQDEFVRLAALDAIRRLRLQVPWAVLEPLLHQPMLVATALQLAAQLPEPRAAPFFSEQLVTCSGKSWLTVVAAFRRYAEQSPVTRNAARAELRKLPDESITRLDEAVREARAPDGSPLVLLALRGGDTAVARTMDLVGDDDSEELVRACVRLLGAEALSGLRRCLGDGRAPVRAAVVELLAGLADDESLRSEVLTLLRGRAHDEQPSVVRAWLHATTRWGDPDDLSIAFDEVSASTNPAVLRAATAAFEAGAARHPQLARQLAAGISPLSERALAVAGFIAALDEPVFDSRERDVDWLAHALTNQSAAVRVAAIDALSNLANAPMDPVGFCLADDVPEVQLAAVRALGRAAAAGQRSPLERLLQLSATSSNVGLVVAALQALGGTRAPQLIERLQPLLQHRDVWRASAAVAALAGYPRDVRNAALRLALGHPEPEVVKSALELLVPDVSTLEDLRGCLHHPAWDVRRIAADRLGEINSEVAGTALKDRLAAEREPLVAAAIYRSLSQLATRRAITWSMLPPDSGRGQ